MVHFFYHSSLWLLSSLSFSFSFLPLAVLRHLRSGTSSIATRGQRLCLCHCHLFRLETRVTTTANSWGWSTPTWQGALSIFVRLVCLLDVNALILITAHPNKQCPRSTPSGGLFLLPAMCTSATPKNDAALASKSLFHTSLTAARPFCVRARKTASPCPSLSSHCCESKGEPSSFPLSTPRRNNALLVE